MPRINGRQKGARIERLAAKDHRDIGCESCERSARNGVRGAGDLVGCLPGAHCEVKGDKKWTVWKVMAQAERDAKDGALPYGYMKINGEEPVLVVRFRNLRELAARVAAIEGRPIYPWSGNHADNDDRDSQ